MSEKLERLAWHRQGAVITTALGATYPTGAPLADNKEAPSNSLGVFIAKRNMGAGVGIRITAERTGADPTAIYAVYGYIRSYQTAALPPVVTALAEWDHLANLFNGVTIAPTSQAVGGVSVISHAANAYRYTEFLPGLGGLYERILVLPVTITADTSILVDIGLQEGG